MPDSPPSCADETQILSLKRRIAVLEEQNAELRMPTASEKTTKNLALEGRVIRRLVCLTERVDDMVAEFDRRIALGASDISEADVLESSDPTENRRYRSYKKLLVWCPSVRKLVQSSADSSELAELYSKLNCGADGARADDTTNLKFIIAVWLMQMVPTPKPPIQCRDKYGRGFYHDNDVTVREAIRSYHPDYHVTAYSWPSFLYKNGQYDAINPTKGFLKGELLVKAVKYIFTSPSSAEEDPEILQPDASTETPSQVHLLKRRRTTGERRTRCDVAGLLQMKSVQPRALAYTAVQLRFALSSAGAWRIIDDDFDHNEFYHNIVDYFELPSSPDAAKEAENLLLWWNRYLATEM
ncbi:hypothetical protein BD769DRAFT_1672622 [Suillus cothurnatus]|nr:hypothetical protein BD769DRAFT_1672622 [Suillus cothurnatus]